MDQLYGYQMVPATTSAWMSHNLHALRVGESWLPPGHIAVETSLSKDEVFAIPGVKEVTVGCRGYLLDIFLFGHPLRSLTASSWDSGTCGTASCSRVTLSSNAKGPSLLAASLPARIPYVLLQKAVLLNDLLLLPHPAQPPVSTGAIDR